MAFTKLINLDTLKTAVNKLKTLIAGKVDKTGDTMTGKLQTPILETGTDESNYFQSKKFRGEGNAGSYYHAIDFGYANHNKVDFHEYGGVWNFYQNTDGQYNTGSLVASIKPDGVYAALKGNADTATKATQDAKGNVIDATYIKTADGLKKWYGTKAEYDALTSYDDDTIYCSKLSNGMFVGCKHVFGGCKYNYWDKFFCLTFWICRNGAWVEETVCHRNPGRRCERIESDLHIYGE